MGGVLTVACGIVLRVCAMWCVCVSVLTAVCVLCGVSVCVLTVPCGVVWYVCVCVCLPVPYSRTAIHWATKLTRIDCLDYLLKCAFRIVVYSVVHCPRVNHTVFASSTSG